MNSNETHGDPNVPRDISEFRQWGYRFSLGKDRSPLATVTSLMPRLEQVTDISSPTDAPFDYEQNLQSKPYDIEIEEAPSKDAAQDSAS